MTDNNISATGVKRVVIFSTPTCHFCAMAKDYFKSNNVPYEEFNVAADSEKRKEMMEKSGQLGVPVILIDDEVVIGFNKSKLSRLLNIPNTPNVTPAV